MNTARYKINRVVETRYQLHTRSALSMPQFDILCKTPPKVLVRQFVERFERPSGEKIALCAAELTYLCWMITHNGTAIKRATFMSYNTIISNSLSFDIEIGRASCRERV